VAVCAPSSWKRWNASATRRSASSASPTGRP
jgi:hypothetical protein